MIGHGRTWTTERLEQLKQHFDAGRTCAEIAAEIGVSRNAVIGKIHRLGYARIRVPSDQARAMRERRPRASGQRLLLRLLRSEFPSPAAEPVIKSAQPCSLFELDAAKCCWPTGEPGAADFAFCGNVRAKGFSYCAGHARLAYRHAGVRRRA